VEAVVVEAFSSVSSCLIDRIEHNKTENHILAATRDLLLPKLMSGEITLRDAEQRLEAAQ
jgi:type I restriction enzyme S subunit